MSQMFKQYLYAWLRLRCLWAISYLFHYLCLYLPRVFVKRTSKYILLNVLVCSIADYFLLGGHVNESCNLIGS